MRFFYGWAVVATSFLTLFLNYGIIFSMGLYFKPLIQEFGWSRASVSLIVSFMMLVFGFSQPIIGRLLDKYKPKRIIAASLLVMGVGLILSSRVSSFWQLYFTLGLLTGLGYSGASALSNAVLVSRWFSRKRGLALGISGSGVNAGQLVIIPLSMYLILAFDWRASLLLMGLLVLLVLLPSALLVFKNDPREINLAPDGDGALHSEASSVSVSREGASFASALKTRSFWFLALAFFTCGFTAHGVFMHFPLFAMDLGVSEAKAANILAIVGAVSMLGVLAAGSLSDKLGSKNPLAAVYFMRGIAMLLLLQAKSEAMLYIFVLLFGFSYFATVPLTSKLVRDIYGQASMGAILGSIWFSHAMGQAFGPYLGGASFDAMHSYSIAFEVSALILFVAALFSYLVEEKRNERVAI